MSQQKQRRPVFQSGEDAEPVRIDPPMKLPEEDLDDLVGDIEPVVDSVPEPAAKPSSTLGWSAISDAQKNGKSYVVTHDPHDKGGLGFWRRTRVMKNFRWVLNARWSDPLTREDLNPQPEFYKELAGG